MLIPTIVLITEINSKEVQVIRYKRNNNFDTYWYGYKIQTGSKMFRSRKHYDTIIKAYLDAKKKLTK